MQPFKLQLIPVQCCLCMSQIHTECVDIPIKLLFKGAQYYDLLEKDFGELIHMFENFKNLDARTQHEDIFDMRQRMIDLLKGDQVIYYICRVCQESRKIDVICDIMSIKADSIADLEMPIDFNDCYCLVKFLHASYIHAIWVEYSTVEDLGKFKIQGFQKKYNVNSYQDLIHHQQAMRLEDYGDKFHNIETTTMIPYRIIDQFRKGKYFYVKWKNIDYTMCTWEPSHFVNKNCMNLKSEYYRMLQTQDLINDCTSIGANYRFDIMRSRDFHPNLIPFTPYVGTPAFLNKANESMKLHEYQVEGLNWLIDSWFKKTNVILADEMGLGKTVQAISFISYLMNVQMITRPFLICVPLSTIENWVREFQQWCPEARVLTYSAGNAGNINVDKSRPIIRELEFFYETFQTTNNKHFSSLRIPKFNVLLTSYQMLVTDYKQLVSIPWRCVIIDEGQRLKSCDTGIFRKAITLVSEHRILLSGTPLQNNIGELFNLLEYLDPVKFSAETRQDFQNMFAESVMLNKQTKVFNQRDAAALSVAQNQINTLVPSQTQSIANSQGNTSQIDPEVLIIDIEEQLARISDEGVMNVEKEKGALDQLQTLLKPHILRRFKRDVFKTFPKKKEVILRVEMTQKQKALSRAIVEKNFEALSQFEKSNNTGVKVSIRNADNVLMMLRMISNHPLHLTDLYGTELFRQRNQKKGSNMQELINKQQSDLSNVQAYIRDSGKLQYLDKMMDRMFEDGHRILLFTQFRGTLDILCDFLQMKLVKYLRLDGETENLKRQKLIDLFNASNSDYKIFLLSTKAGGLGINLTSADTIIIFDSDFNPHNDVQALNRAHRIGQKNNVMIYRFICKNSVEERILEAAKHKLMLDTMMTHSAKTNIKEESNSLYQILKFGAKRLFEEQGLDVLNNNQDYVLDDEQLSAVLDRNKHFQELEEEEQQNHLKDDSVRDYLSGFKVASIENKVVAPIKKQNQELVDDDSSSDDEQIKKVMASSNLLPDTDNNLFQRLHAELKAKENLDKVSIDISVADFRIKTRNQLREDHNGKPKDKISIQPKFDKTKKNDADYDISQDLLRMADNESGEQLIEELKQEQIILPEKFYIMSPEYAEFVGGLSSGKFQLHHDGQLYFAQILGQMTTHINQSSNGVQKLMHQEDNSERVSQLLSLMKPLGKISIDYLKILQMNEDPMGITMIPFIKLWGFDIANIKDFIEAFMTFGVQNKNYVKLFQKINKRYKLRGHFTSLFYIQEHVFTIFCKHFFEFWCLITEDMPLVIDIPQFIFAQKTSVELATRNYDICLLNTFCKELELLTPIYTNENYRPLIWDTSIDNYILAKLILRYGFDQYHHIVKDNIWILIGENYSCKLSGLIKGAKTISVNIKREDRYTRIVLYEKLSGLTFESLKMQYRAQNPPGMQINMLILNEYMDNYCCQMLSQVTMELILQLEQAQQQQQ